MIPIPEEHPPALLPIKKPGMNNYHPIQDLRVINEAVITLHSMLHSMLPTLC